MAEGLLRRRGKATWRFRCPFCLGPRSQPVLGAGSAGDRSGNTDDDQALNKRSQPHRYDNGYR